MTRYADTDTVDLVDEQSILYTQRVCGTFLYYAIAAEQKMFVSLNTIYTAQAHATTTIMWDIVWLLNYSATQPDATSHYHASNTILNFARYVSYICEERAHSRSGGNFL